MKHAALLLTMLALPLGACAMAPVDGEGGSDEQVSATSDELMWWYVRNPAPTLIDFDSDPKGVAIANGTIIDTTYSSLGVTFSCIVCSSGHAYARQSGRSGNSVSLWPSGVPAFDSRYGAVRADFAAPRSFVSIDVLGVLPPEYAGTPVARPWLEAYNAANQMIGSTVYYPAYGTTGFGQWQTLRIDDPTASIKWVRFSSQRFSTSPAVYGVFDNLSFNTDPYWVEVTPIEKPVVLKPVFQAVR